jgi:membrane-associated protein
MIEPVIHLDRHLGALIQYFGGWSYLVLFLIIFAETGLVITPFLPGDSLLFAVGALAAVGSFDILWLFITLLSAAVIGDSVNYAVGKFFGEKAFKGNTSRFFKKEYLDRTHAFYERHGGKTIVLARFVPIIRTFAPFVAGMGSMEYAYFFIYNVVGALLWVAAFVLGGYFFGNIPLIKKNFSLVILAVIALSILPIAMELWKHRISRFFKTLYLKLFRIHDTPERIATGFALGVFLGIMPATGPFAALLVAVLLKVNRAAALLGSVLTNTWLSIPVFLLSVKTGSIITGLSYSDIRADWSALLGGFSLDKLFHTSLYKILAPVLMGYLLVSAAIGIAAYMAVYIVMNHARPKSPARKS